MLYLYMHLLFWGISHIPGFLYNPCYCAGVRVRFFPEGVICLIYF